MFFETGYPPHIRVWMTAPLPPLIRMSGSASVDSKVKIFLVDTFDVFDKLLTFMD